jgi:hypothetical protein
VAKEKGKRSRLPELKEQRTIAKEFQATFLQTVPCRFLWIRPSFCAAFVKALIIPNRFGSGSISDFVSISDAYKLIFTALTV